MDTTTDTFSGAHASAMDPTTTDEVREAVDDVASSLEQLYRVSDAYVGRQAEERPYAVLGAALGVGFVLGGGLTSRLGGVLATLGSRLLLSRLVDDWLAGGERGA